MVLPDYLRTGLDAVICGTAVGKRSCERRHYYSGRGNKLWKVLYDTKLTPEGLSPSDDAKVLEYRLGLTDLVKHNCGSDATLHRSMFDVEGFKHRILECRPRFVAFNGKTAAQRYFGKRDLEYGRQDQKIGETVVFVLPSTFGAANWYWNADLWHVFAKSVRNCS